MSGQQLNHDYSHITVPVFPVLNTCSAAPIFVKVRNIGGKVKFTSAAIGDGTAFTLHTSFLPGPFEKTHQSSDMIFDSFPFHHRQRTQLTAVATSSPSVPVELYRPIVEAVGSRHDLYTILFVSKAMRAESERLLYRKITIKSGTSPSKANMRLLKHLSECQRVAFHVRNLVILNFTTKDGRNKIRNLTTLSCPNAGRNKIAAEEYFRTLNRALCALQLLQHLHLENGFYTRNDTFTCPPFSLLSGCTFQLKSLSMVPLCTFDRSGLEDQKYIERLYILMADSNSLSQATFPRLSSLTLLQSTSTPGPEPIKGIKKLFIDIVTLQNNAVFQSPLVNITSFTLCDYDPSILVDIPYLFPSVRILALYTDKLTLTVLEERIQQIRGLKELRKVCFASWTERQLPTKAVASQWLSKLINVRSITIQDHIALTSIEWVRGAEQWVKHKLQSQERGGMLVFIQKNQAGDRSD